jgi:hypothetical protein
MKCHSVKHKPMFCKQNIMTVALYASLAVLGACSSSDDGNGAAAGDLSAFNFNASNSTIAAEIAAAAMSFFPGYHQVSQVVIDKLVNGDPNNSPFPLVGLCNGGGSATLTWNDIDGNNVLSVDDTASLQFTNCDFDGSGETVTGTVDITATSVDLDPPPNSIGYTTSVNLAISLVPETTTILANFKATTSTQDNIDFTNVYIAEDAPGQTLTVTENGTEYFKMGCFDVTQTFNVAGIELAPSGAIVASNKVLSLAGGPSLSFVNDAMNAGTKRLLSISVPACGSIGSPGGVDDSDGSYMEIEALGGGNLRLHTFDVNNVETSSVDTTWDLLTD